MLRFLTAEENFPAVLKVISHAHEIHEYVANSFLEKLDAAIAKKKPAAILLKLIPLKLNWPRNSEDGADNSFNFVALMGLSSGAGKGLDYGIDIHGNHLDIGIHWKSNAKQRVEQSRLKSVKRLQNELQGRSKWQEPHRDWFGWECFDEYPVSDDPWLTLHERSDDWITSIAVKFWDLISAIHDLVVAANKEIAKNR